jgi:hypothetical protein
MYRVRFVLRAALLCGAVMLVPVTGSASAQPPSNDTFADATVISSLPFSDTVNTTQATTDATDAEAATACGEGGITLSATVWYAFTPSADQLVTVNTAGSNYTSGVIVVTGQPGSFSGVTCNLGEVEFVAHAGQTYYMDAVDVFGGAGGTLDLSASGKPLPVVTVDPSGRFNPSTGAATVTGSLSCAATFSGSSISASLVEPVGRGAVSGSASAAVSSCGGVPQPWSIIIDPSIGTKFTGGHANVTASFSFCDQVCGLVQSVKQSILLRR